MRRFLPFAKAPPTVAVVRLSGLIGGTGRTGATLTDAALAPMLERAFSRRNPDAVAIVVNSPGGSPVQSSLIASRIRRLATEHEVPVTAFVEDLAASGGYWLATAADEIFADPMSILGSIGVISASFGVHDLISRFGIERRVYTAGTSKSMLDPFRPEKPEDVARLKAILEDVHASFIAHVRDRRGDRLDPETDLFDGRVWVGERAVSLGLADGIGHLVPVMRERFGKKTRFIPYGQRRSLLQRIGASAAEGVLGVAEHRLAAARYGA